MNMEADKPFVPSVSEADSTELVALRALSDQGVEDVFGTPIGDLIAKASQRLSALKLLLEAERAFGLEGPSDNQRPIVEAESKCDQARVLLEEIRYPDDRRFEARRTALGGDLQRASALKAALRRWRDIHARLAKLDQALISAQTQADKKNLELEAALSSVKDVVGQREKTLLEELETTRKEAQRRHQELTDEIQVAAASIRDLVGSYTTLMDSLLKTGRELSAEMNADSEGLSAWREFIDETMNFCRSLDNTQAIRTAAPSLLALLQLKKERLVSPWKELGGQMLDQMHRHYCVVRQGLIDMEQWARFTELARSFSQEILRLADGSPVNVSSILAPGRAILAAWQEVEPSDSLLKTIASNALQEMERQESLASARYEGQRVRETEFWLTLAEGYLAPQEATEAGQQDAHMVPDPASALFCVARAERILNEIVPGIREDLAPSESALRDRVARTRRDAASALSELPSKQFRQSAKELLSRRANWEADAARKDDTSFLRHDSRARELIDDLSTYFYLLREAGFDENDQNSVRHLLDVHRLDAVFQRQLADATRGWPLAATTLTGPEISSLLDRTAKGLDDVEREFRNRLQDCTVWESEIACWRTNLEVACRVLLRAESLERRRSGREKSLKAFLTDVQDHLKTESDLGLEGKHLVRSIVSLVSFGKRDKPSIVFKYWALRSDTTHIATKTSGAKSAESKEKIAKGIAKKWWKGRLHTADDLCKAIQAIPGFGNDQEQRKIWVDLDRSHGFYRWVAFGAWVGGASVLLGVGGFVGGNWLASRLAGVSIAQGQVGRDAETLKQYSGDYRFASKASLTIVQRKSELFARRNGAGEEAMLAIGPRAQGLPVRFACGKKTLHFCLNDDQKVTGAIVIQPGSRETAIRTEDELPSLNQATYKNYEGEYRMDSGPPVVISLEGGVVYYNRGGHLKAKLFAGTENRFILEGTCARIEFSREPDKEVTHLTLQRPRKLGSLKGVRRKTQEGDGDTGTEGREGGQKRTRKQGETERDKETRGRGDKGSETERGRDGVKRQED